MKISLLALAGAIAAAVGVAVAAPADRKPSQGNTASPSHERLHIAGQRGRLGIGALDISSQLREHFGAPADRGVLVDTVAPDSPAAHAGVEVGDLIVDVAGEPTASARDVRDALSGHGAGDVVDVDVIRAGKHVALHATLDRAPDDAAADLHGGFPSFGDEWPFDFQFDPGHPDDQIQQLMDRAREMFDRMQKQAHSHAGAPGVRT